MCPQIVQGLEIWYCKRTVPMIYRRKRSFRTQSNHARANHQPFNRQVAHLPSTRSSWPGSIRQTNLPQQDNPRHQARLNYSLPTNCVSGTWGRNWRRLANLPPWRNFSKTQSQTPTSTESPQHGLNKSYVSTCYHVSEPIKPGT